MSYDIYCYRSRIGKPDIDEAIEVLEADCEIQVKVQFNAHSVKTIQYLNSYVVNSVLCCTIKFEYI